MNLEVLIGLIGIGVATLAMIGGLLTFREFEGRNSSPNIYGSGTEVQSTPSKSTAHTSE